MKKLKNLNPFASVAALFSFMLLVSAQTIAQVTEKVDVNINADGGAAWYASPWVWALGVAVFVIIIVAITRGNSRSEI